MNGRAVEIARGAWGAMLLLRTTDVLQDAGRLTVDHRSETVTRILGARQLAQSLLSGVRPSPEVLAMGVWVDATHAVTALALAVSDRPRARAGVIDTGVAATWAVLGYHALTKARATPPGHDRVRDALARRVLAVVPGGRQLARLVRDARDGSVTAGGPVSITGG